MGIVMGSLRRGAVVVAGLLAMTAALANADEPLRWKFNKGAKYDYTMLQDMTIGSEGGPLGAQNVTMHQELGMTWDVQDVSPEGNAIIQQKIDRVKMKMTLPAPVGVIEYDSASDKAPAGPAAMLAPMYKAMMTSAFEITMTPRGEIKDVKIPEEVVTALKNSPGAAAMGDMATAEGFKKMISQGSLVLPEKAPEVGKEWSNKVEVNNPAAGKQIVETTYKFDGIKDVEGVQYAVFRPTIKMSFEGAQVKITEQTSDGEILFNVGEGRLSSSKIGQHVTLEQAGAGKTKIDQDIVVNVTPAGERKSEQEAAPAAETAPAAEAAAPPAEEKK